MSTMKIVKDAEGRIMGFGPNSDQYEPVIPPGGTLEYGDEAVVYVEPVEAAPFAELKAVEITDFLALREQMCSRVDGIGNRFTRMGVAARRDEQAALSLDPPEEAAAAAYGSAAALYEAGAASCDMVVVGLLSVLQHASVTGATDIDALKQALKARYLTAVSAATPQALAEFKKYDK